MGYAAIMFIISTIKPGFSVHPVSKTAFGGETVELSCETPSSVDIVWKKDGNDVSSSVGLYSSAHLMLG